MRHLLIFAVVALSVSSQRWVGYDVLSKAHGGIFSVLPWTDEELNDISELHARGEYHKLMREITAKLVKSHNISSEKRHLIENFLLSKRPPTVFDHLFHDSEKDLISYFHEDGDVDGVLSIWKAALERLKRSSEFLHSTVMYYITSP